MKLVGEMAKRLGTVAVLCTAVSVGVEPALAIIPGMDEDYPFHNPRSDYYGMNWDYVYQTGAGTSVAIGYFALLTARHYPIENGATFLLNGDEFEVISQEFLPTDVGTMLPPDLRVLRLRNNTEPLRPLPGFYQLRAAPLNREEHANMVLVGTGLSGQSRYNLFYQEDPNTGRAKRWGTNGFAGAALQEHPEGSYATRCFRMDFQRGATPHESGYGTGDSGGGVFARGCDGQWRLAGINLYREGIEGWYSDVWAASIPAYAPWLHGVLKHDVLPGDADLDGDVDFRDYLRLKAALDVSDAVSWRNGDFDVDGDVDRDDFRAVWINFGYRSAGHPVMIPPTSPAPGAEISGQVAPEPGVLGLLAVGAPILLGHRRRRRPCDAR